MALYRKLRSDLGFATFAIRGNDIAYVNKHFSEDINLCDFFTEMTQRGRKNGIFFATITIRPPIEYDLFNHVMDDYGFTQEQRQIISNNTTYGSANNRIIAGK